MAPWRLLPGPSIGCIHCFRHWQMRPSPMTGYSRHAERTRAWFGRDEVVRRRMRAWRSFNVRFKPPVGWMDGRMDRVAAVAQLAEAMRDTERRSSTGSLNQPSLVWSCLVLYVLLVQLHVWWAYASFDDIYQSSRFSLYISLSLPRSVSLPVRSYTVDVHTDKQNSKHVNRCRAGTKSDICRPLYGSLP
ncbi:unnamed protein product [Periconia digitata]|uniref:Uncharacterized protein n=1 Tax=Periconia digitata TaxID=1303443 RepID=A0A9W4U1Q9_9PLEO|nr:unnamed protein product [Periconia digitata]